MSDWKETGLPCPCNISSDAYAINSKGDGHCFRCNKHFFNNEGKGEDLDNSDITAEFHEHRGISKKTFQKFNVMTKMHRGEPFEVGFFYPNGAVKIREYEEKKFRTQGDMKNATLFGKNIFDRGSRRVITLTEGEYDTLAVYEMIGDESAVVSIRSASSAKADCKAEYDYINSFEKIVINFDNDDPGQDAAKKVASLFDFKKVFNLVLDKYKDANDYLKNNDVKDYYQAWRSAKRYTPDNILSTYEDFAEALKEKREECLATYPFTSLQNALYGLHSGEVVVFKGEEGIGKSETFRAIESHVLKTTKHPIGIIHLEEDNGTTLRGLASYFTGQSSMTPDSMVSDDDVLSSIMEMTGGDEGRIYLHSSFDVEDEDAFTDTIRFLAAACGCRIIMLDHISWLATGGDNDDERKKLDRISQKLKLLAKELKFCLIEISHVNDDGKTRGSRNITKVANTVIHLHRDKVHSDPVERNKMYMLVEKARLTGAKTGPVGYAVYDTESMMLVDPQTKGIGLPE